MTTFPLFHLPLVAMEHVLCMMPPFDLIDLSKTSSRAKRAVKRFLRLKPKFEISIGYTEEPHIILANINESWGSFRTTDESRIGYETETLLSLPFHKTIKHSMNPYEEWMKEYEYVKGFLDCRLAGVFYGAFTDLPRQFNEIGDWILTKFRQSRLDNPR
uniref:F-box domain-containing protein n=1 Tax=Caenorhabditis tropicalis TaxID=1561998 RepID=A0A1I7TUK6_9PELO